MALVWILYQKLQILSVTNFNFFFIQNDCFETLYFNKIVFFEYVNTMATA